MHNNICRRKNNTNLRSLSDLMMPIRSSVLWILRNELTLIAEKEKLDNEYQSLIAEGDKLFNAGHYDLATSKYKEAQAIKSMDDYPQNG